MIRERYINTPVGIIRIAEQDGYLTALDFADKLLKNDSSALLDKTQTQLE